MARTEDEYPNIVASQSGPTVKHGPSGALIIASKAQGYDPTKILNPATGQYDGSIADWNPERNIQNPKGLNPLPGGLPAVSGTRDATETPELTERVTFSVPDAGRETAKRATTNANPFPAMPGSK